MMYESVAMVLSVSKHIMSLFPLDLSCWIYKAFVKENLMKLKRQTIVNLDCPLTHQCEYNNHQGAFPIKYCCTIDNFTNTIWKANSISTLKYNGEKFVLLRQESIIKR